jgi:hypothetical protein
MLQKEIPLARIEPPSLRESGVLTTWLCYILSLKISFSVSSTANRSPGSQQKFGQDTEDDFKGRSTRV